MAKISWIDILIIILFIATLYFVLTRIFGHSASDLTISISLFILLGSLIYKINREIGEFKVKTINSFRNLREDLNDLKNTY